MFSLSGDIFRTISLLFQLVVEEITDVASWSAGKSKVYWRSLKRFFLISTIIPLTLFAIGFLLKNTTLFIIGGIFLGASFVLVTLAFTPLISLISHFLKKDEKTGERYVKSILTIWFWELLTVFYCVVFPVWNDYQILAFVALCTLILSLAGVVWGVSYITWFRKVLIFLVLIGFIVSSISLILPQTAELIRKSVPRFDKQIVRHLTTKKAGDNLKIADVNYDGFVDSLDVVLLSKFLFDLKVFPDSSRGDVNGDGKIDSIDVRYLNDYLFHQGPPPKKRKIVYKPPSRKPSKTYTQNSEPKQTEVELTLDTNKPFWNTYDLDIPSGCIVEFEASGSFIWDRNVSSPRVGPEGAPWTPRQKADDPDEFLLPNSRIVCLMARVGNTTYSIGSGGQFYVERGGRLQLAINERWSSARNWADNSGLIRVRVRIT